MQSATDAPAKIISRHAEGCVWVSYVNYLPCGRSELPPSFTTPCAECRCHSHTSIVGLTFASARIDRRVQP